MKTPPANADKDKPKTIKGVEYHWYTKHARWGGHTKSECKGMARTKTPKLPKATQLSTNNGTPRPQ